GQDVVRQHGGARAKGAVGAERCRRVIGGSRPGNRKPQRSEALMTAGPTIGRSSPPRAPPLARGGNLSPFSRTARGVELLLFDREDDAGPARVVRLDPATNRTYHYWHVFVPGVRPGQLYGYRVEGPADPANGLRFDSRKVLLDPYGRAVVVPANYARE